jgi:hypothetical protein
MRRTIRLLVFLVCPYIRRRRYRACLLRIEVLEREHFPQWFPAPLPVSDPKGARPLKRVKEEARSKLLVMQPTLEAICAQYFLPVAQQEACGQLALNTGQDSKGDWWLTVSCLGCQQVSYKKFRPRDYFSPSRGEVNTEGLMYELKSFFAVSVKDMHHANEALPLRAIGA